MISRKLSGIFVLFLFLSMSALAQEEDIQSIVYAKVDKMKKVLQLTQAQADAVSPIVKDYLTKRQAILQEAAGEGLVDHVALKSTLERLKEGEYQKLSKILSKDQMEKWINRENMLASLNPDSGGSTVDDDTGFGLDGASFKF